MLSTHAPIDVVRGEQPDEDEVRGAPHHTRVARRDVEQRQEERRALHEEPREAHGRVDEVGYVLCKVCSA